MCDSVSYNQPGWEVWVFAPVKWLADKKVSEWAIVCQAGRQTLLYDLSICLSVWSSVKLLYLSVYLKIVLN